jgi:hypothetical protein
LILRGWPASVSSSPRLPNSISLPQQLDCTGVLPGSKRGYSATQTLTTFRRDGRRRRPRSLRDQDIAIDTSFIIVVTLQLPLLRNRAVAPRRVGAAEPHRLAPEKGLLCAQCTAKPPTLMHIGNTYIRTLYVLLSNFF